MSHRLPRAWADSRPVPSAREGCRLHRGAGLPVQRSAAGARDPRSSPSPPRDRVASGISRRRYTATAISQGRVVRRGEKSRHLQEPVPAVTILPSDDGITPVPRIVAERIAARELLHVLCQVQFGRVGDVARDGSLGELCRPARSRIRQGDGPAAATAADIGQVLVHDLAMATPALRCGQIAPKRSAVSMPWSCGACWREPRFTYARVSVRG